MVVPLIRKRIEISYDAEADAAYIYVKARGKDRVVARTQFCDIELPQAAVAVAFDDTGRIAGFEVLGASRVLPSELLRPREPKGAPAPEADPDLS